MMYKRGYILEMTSDGDTTTLDSSKAGNPLNIKFRVEHLFNGYGSKAEITVYNMNPDKAARAQKELKSVKLDAGYYGGGSSAVGNIFAGEVVNAFFYKEGLNTVLKMTCYSGEGAIRSKQYGKVYGRNTPHIDVVKDVASQLGKPVRIKSELSGEFIMGYTVTGSVKSIMDKLAGSLGFTWSIINNAVVIRKNNDKETNGVVHIGAEELLEGGTSYDITQVSFAVKLKPDLMPLTKVNLKTRSAQFSASSAYFAKYGALKAGEYQANEVVFTGDFEGDDWDTNVTCLRL